MTTVDRAGRSDLRGIVAIYNEVLGTSNANFDTEPATVESRGPWFDQFATMGPYRLLVARSGEEVVGYACSGRYRDHIAFAQTVEFSVSLHPGFRGQGVGSMLYTALLEELVAEPVHVALAGIALPNDPSVALHKKFGFTEVGVFAEYAVKNGEFISSVWLQRTFPPPGSRALTVQETPPTRGQRGEGGI